MITANVIHKPDRKDRYDLITKEAQKQGFEIRWWDAIVEFPPKTGICKAHKQIIRWAKEQNLPYVLVLEDDCAFTDKGAMDRFVSTIPEDYDIYLGGVCIKEDIPADRVLHRFCCMHCYIVHNKFYDTFLGIRENTDIETALIGIGKYIVHYPFLAVQHSTFSDNTHKNWVFDRYMINKKLWVNEL